MTDRNAATGREAPRPTAGLAATVVAAAVLGTAALHPVAAPAATRDTGAGSGLRARATVGRLPRFTYVAHRGGSLEGRENSLSGLTRAFRSGTVQVLDMDTQMLRDGTVVLMHDATVDRTTNGTGRVSRFTPHTWGRLRLDQGSWLRPRPPRESPPSLAEVLDRFGGRSVLSIEPKGVRSLATISGMVRRRGLTRSVLLNTNHPRVARRIHRLGLHAQLWRSAGQMRGDRPASFAPYVDVLDIDLRVDDGLLRRFLRSGVRRVWAHTLTTRAQRHRARSLGLSGVVTDDPRYLRGRSSRYPAPPTRVDVVARPGRAQVSDRSSAKVLVAGLAGPAVPGARVKAVAAGVRARSVRTSPTGEARLVLRVRGGGRGKRRVSLVVPAGGDRERHWPRASARTRLRVAPEDLQLQPRVSVRGRRLAVRVRTLDSSAAGYTGARRERGARRTIAGLRRARLALVLRSHGNVLGRATLRGRDGSRRDGSGTVRHTWRVPGPGRYVVRVRETAGTYDAAPRVRVVRVR